MCVVGVVMATGDVTPRDVWLLGLREAAGQRWNAVFRDGDASRRKIHYVRQLGRHLQFPLAVRRHFSLYMNNEKEEVEEEDDDEDDDDDM